jgi:hypothetical protein
VSWANIVVVNGLLIGIEQPAIGQKRLLHKARLWKTVWSPESPLLHSNDQG